MQTKIEIVRPVDDDGFGNFATRKIRKYTIIIIYANPEHDVTSSLVELMIILLIELPKSSETDYI